MNAIYQSIIVAAVKALTGAGYNTAPAITNLLNAPGEPDSQARKDLKTLFAVNAYSRDAPQASADSVEAKLRGFVGLVGGGESIKVTAPGVNGGLNVYSVS